MEGMMRAKTDRSMAVAAAASIVVLAALACGGCGRGAEEGNSERRVVPRLPTWRPCSTTREP